MSIKNSPTVGDILIRSKYGGLVDHVGVVVEHNCVLHNTPERGEHLVSIQEFSKDAFVQLRKTGANAGLVIQRARKILTRPLQYNLFRRNCEHTANEVITGEAQSPYLFLIGMGIFAFIGLLLLKSK